MYKTASRRTGGETGRAHALIHGGEASAIAELLFDRPSKNRDEIERRIEFQRRITLRYFSWEGVGAHRYRENEVSSWSLRL